MHSRTKFFLVFALAAIVLAAACAPGPNSAEKTAGKDGEVAGFWKGLWHGLISPITFIVSLFSKNVDFYEVHNNGGWYNFGFVIGAGLFLSGGILGKNKGKRKSC
jgi:hypothetical protein